MIQKKICLLGSFAVGKTSLIQRFVNSIFSEKYHTTVGVKIDKKEVSTSNGDVNLVIWDLAGEDEFQQLRTSYMRGSSGFIFVADSTRNESLQDVIVLLKRSKELYPNCPVIVLINKVDLESDWDLEAAQLSTLAESHTMIKTSAKTGSGVDEAFHFLSEAMLNPSVATAPKGNYFI